MNSSDLLLFFIVLIFWSLLRGLLILSALFDYVALLADCLGTQVWWIEWEGMVMEIDNLLKT